MTASAMTAYDSYDSFQGNLPSMTASKAICGRSVVDAAIGRILGVDRINQCSEPSSQALVLHHRSIILLIADYKPYKRSSEQSSIRRSTNAAGKPSILLSISFDYAATTIGGRYMPGGNFTR